MIQMRKPVIGTVRNFSVQLTDFQKEETPIHQETNGLFK